MPAYDAPRTIVGRWAFDQSGCRSPAGGLVEIGPLSLTSDEMSCSFSSVERHGSAVSWAGRCDEGNGNKPMHVTAVESASKLTIQFKTGGTWSPLIRCGG